MNFLRYLRPVLWSFIGLGRSRHASELREANPLVFVGIAFVLVLVFLGALALTVHAVAG